MKYDELEKKIREVFEGFDLESVKTEFITERYDTKLLEQYGLEAVNIDYTEIVIKGVVREKT